MPRFVKILMRRTSGALAILRGNALPTYWFRKNGRSICLVDAPDLTADEAFALVSHQASSGVKKHG